MTDANMGPGPIPQPQPPPATQAVLTAAQRGAAGVTPPPPAPPLLPAPTPAPPLPVAVQIVRLFIPDLRTIIAASILALAFYLVWAMIYQPQLLKNPAFTGFVGLILGSGGVGALTAWGFGGTKTGGEVMSTQNKLLSYQATTNPNTPP